MWMLSDTAITQFVGQYLWPFFRITGLFMAMPVIGTKIVPARARMALAIALTILVTPLLPPIPSVPPLSVQSFLIILQQVIIGLSMGFMLQVTFQIFVLAGQFIAMKMGLGFASMNDPANGVSVTVISQYYLIMATLLFLVMDGHLVVIEMVVQSFQVFPIADTGITTEMFWQMALTGSWLFNRALLISLPVLTSLLVVNLAFGVMSRAAPQMNVFAVGFPVTLLFGLALIWFSTPIYLGNFQTYLNETFSFLNNMLGMP